MQIGLLVADANGRTDGERCGLPPTRLSAAASGLEYAHCQLSGQGMGDERPSSTLWAAKQSVAVRIIFVAYAWISCAKVSRV